jgi:hypothetical protein
MDSIFLFGIIGIGAGIIGLLAGVVAMIWGLGLGEYLGGKKKQSANPISKDELKQLLVNLNSSDLPYSIKPAENTDLLVEWKFVDAKWYSLFSKAGLRQTYRAFLVLDPQRVSARYCEEMVGVEWVAGTDGLRQPRFHYQSEFFRGRILFKKSMGIQYGIKEDLSLGKIYQYDFDIRTVRDPIKHAIEESGWEFVPVVNKSHATYKSLKNVLMRKVK